jgi:osmoprotectant transport system permease protein
MAPLVSPLVSGYINFVARNHDQLLIRLLEHAEIVAISIALAVPIGVLLGTLITFNDTAATIVLWLAGITMTVPSIALFGLLIPVVGIGTTPVIVALVLYSQLPIIRNTYVGLTDVDPAAIEAGRGMGMTTTQRLWRVQLPMALPIIMAGVRNAVVILIGIAAIGAFIGAGGLGDFIFRGIGLADVEMIVVATVLLSLLALAFDYGFGVSEQLFRIRNGECVEPALVTRLVQKVIT